MDPIIKAVYCLVLRSSIYRDNGTRLTPSIKNADLTELKKFMRDYHYHKFLRSNS